MYDKNISPVGWYVASYPIRLIELEAADNEDFLGDKFIRWNYFNKLIEYDLLIWRSPLFAQQKSPPSQRSLLS